MAKANVLFREAILETAPEGVAAGTIRLSFSSEHPVMRRDNRGAYWEKLSHAPGDANLGLLNKEGVVLEDHDETRQIGTVVPGSVRVEADKKCRADILITDPKWKERIAKGELPPVSVGYTPLSVVKETRSQEDDIPILEFAWAPYEISLLNHRAADPNVGVGRSAPAETVDSTKTVDVELIAKNLTTEQKNRMKILLDPNPAAGGGAATIDEPKIRAEVAKETLAKASTDFKARTKEIVTIADVLIAENGKRDAGKMADKIRAMANTALQSDESISDFKSRCLEEVLKAKPVDPVFVEDCTDENGMRRYSLQRGIQDCIRGKKRTPGGLEGEVHQEYINQCRQRTEGLGFEPEGEFLVPSHSRRSLMPVSALSRAERMRMVRDQQATVFAQGGATVPTLLMTPIIDLLRNRMVLSEAGVTTLGGLTGNVVIPRQEAPTTAYSVSEIQQITQSILLLGQIALNPKRVGSSITYSKQWLMQSSPDAEGLVREDAFKVIALRWDYLGLSGQGAAGEPLGVFNTPGIGAVTFGATPTYIKMIAFETAIRTQNVTDPLTYISTSTVKGALKGVAEALTGATTIGGSQNALWKPGNTINGYPAIDSQQAPNNLVVCGAFSQLIHALWGGLDVVVDYWTLADKAEIKLSINTWGDYAVRHPQAFCASTDSGNQ